MLRLVLAAAFLGACASSPTTPTSVPATNAASAPAQELQTSPEADELTPFERFRDTANLVGGSRADAEALLGTASTLADQPASRSLAYAFSDHRLIVTSADGIVAQVKVIAQVEADYSPEPDDAYVFVQRHESVAFAWLGEYGDVDHGYLFWEHDGIVTTIEAVESDVVELTRTLGS